MREWMYMDDVELTIDGLTKKYKELQLKAMDDDNDNKVHQFTGSLVALEVLKNALGLDPLMDVEEC